ncbi:N-acetyltransferase [Neobacillus notoginsengisoli]|uniref:N-acetyltransferase n=1 Tax=Neobacillus notoginsengisoli TaxID=1578198 RepID=A0A417YZJ8_9BACI|nr:N-acetyltransferase [Neobacillus notoginsengisoli]RHW43101.1 N-acetyltransferase [Neobacillus notoginsengisoli]
MVRVGIKIRQEVAEDIQAVEEVIKRAFANVEMSDQTEHELVARLRNSEAFVPELSLVAVKGEAGEVIGHILFSKATIGQSETLALAPVSVLPEYQNQGIGGQLINEGLKWAKKIGYGSVIVLGHPEYYPKFGFKKASLWGVKAPWDVPDEAFMALELTPAALEGVFGVVRYSDAF